MNTNIIKEKKKVNNNLFFFKSLFTEKQIENNN